MTSNFFRGANFFGGIVMQKKKKKLKMFTNNVICNECSSL